MGCGNAVNFFDDDDNANGGNGNGDSSYYHYNNKWSPSSWYLGATQCFRANVAYTLYGVKTGESIPDGENPCSEARYVNSFFTRYGFEAFGDALDIDYANYGPSSYCHSADYNYMYYVQYENNHEMYPNAYSYGTGCSADGYFEFVTFPGPYCNGRADTQTTNQLYMFNSDMEAYFSCFGIYNATGANNDDSSGDADAVSYLLARSTVCSMTEYPERCPDPYGIKASRDAKLYRMARLHSNTVPLFIPMLTVLMVAGAAVLFWLTHRRRPEKPRSRWEFMAASFDRAASALTIRTRTLTEKLMRYAEELEDEDSVRVDAPWTYEPPKKSSSVDNRGDGDTGGGKQQIRPPPAEDKSSAADTVVASPVITKVEPPPTATIITTTAAPEKTVKYKRPVMARVSQHLFGHRTTKEKTPPLLARSIRTGAKVQFRHAARTPLSPVSEGFEPPPTPRTIT